MESLKLVDSDPNFDHINQKLKQNYLEEKFLCLII